MTLLESNRKQPQAVLPVLEALLAQGVSDQRAAAPRPRAADGPVVPTSAAPETAEDAARDDGRDSWRGAPGSAPEERLVGREVEDAVARQVEQDDLASRRDSRAASAC